MTSNKSLTTSKKCGVVIPLELIKGYNPPNFHYNTCTEYHFLQLHILNQNDTHIHTHRDTPTYMHVGKAIV